MYVGLYKGAAAEMLNMQDSLSTLKNRVLGGSRADRIAVETALDNLPFYWQAELKDLLAKSEGRV
jgi:hypothetical protein